MTSHHQMVPPREVAGFTAALHQGTVKPVPLAPPPLVQGRTARQAFVSFWVVLGCSIVVGAIVVIVLNRLVPDPWAIFPIVGTGILGFLVVYRSWAQVSRRHVVEFSNGYTTLALQTASFSGIGFGRSSSEQIAWDYSGLWVLDDTGRVLAEPRRDVDPPGFYPSPRYPGSLELWSGSEWTGKRR